MDEKSYEKMPRRMTLARAYQAIYDWYKANRMFLEQKCGHDRWHEPEKFFELLDNLPAPESISNIEIRAILNEVRAGRLEACYHASDGKYKMCAYAHAGIEAGGGQDFTSEEMNELRGSRLWPYLTYSKSEVYE